MKRVAVVLFILLVVSLSGCTRSLIFGRYSIDGLNRCEQFPLNVYNNDKYNREVGAGDYLLFAVAALNSYPVSEIEPQWRYLSQFTVENYDGEWEKKDTGTSKTGLEYDVYWREKPDVLDVMVAIRGTESFSLGDWFSNLSWLTQIIPVPNEYDAMRPRFEAIRESAFAHAGDRKVRFVATGHSLGGGVAQHLAAAFPCVSAAVFNTSPVTNQHNLYKAREGNLTVHIYEDNDELTRLRRYLSPEHETDTYRKYIMNTVPKGKFQHGMTRLVVGMSRLVATCQQAVLDHKRPSCDVAAESTNARKLYCSTFGSPKLDPANRDPDACGDYKWLVEADAQ